MERKELEILLDMARKRAEDATGSDEEFGALVLAVGLVGMAIVDELKEINQHLGLIENR